MADVKVSALTAITSVNDSDIFHVVQSGTSYKVTKANFIKETNETITTTDTSTGGYTTLDGSYPTVAIATDNDADHPIISVRRSAAAGWIISGDELGALFFRGLAPYSNGAGGGMNAFATETWSASAGGTRVRIFTTPNGSITKAVHASFEQNGRTFFGGNVGCGSFTNASYPLTVTSDTYGWAHLNAAGTLKAYFSLATDNSRLYMRNSSGTDIIILNTNGDSTITSKINGTSLNMSNMPNGPTGLSAGDLYEDTAANILSNGDLVVAIKQ